MNGYQWNYVLCTNKSRISVTSDYQRYLIYKIKPYSYFKRNEVRTRFYSNNIRKKDRYGCTVIIIFVCIIINGGLKSKFSMKLLLPEIANVRKLNTPAYICSKVLLVQTVVGTTFLCTITSGHMRLLLLKIS